MKDRQITYRRSALILLVCCLISMAPKAYFHDLLASHNDAKGCGEVHTGTVFHELGYDCQFDDLVVSTPFVLQLPPSFTTGSMYASLLLCFQMECILPSGSSRLDNRGPPSFPA
jgi:hypothetical protein